MRVLVVAIHYPVCSARYAVDALRRLGHEVRSAGPTTGRDIWGIQVEERYVWWGEPPESGWTPELVIFMDAHLTAAKVGTMPHVVYGVDNHVRQYEQYNGIAEHFFLAHGHGFRIGEPGVTWLPCGYDPAWFTPGPAWCARHWDAALIGVRYGPRAEWVAALREALPEAAIQYGMGAIYDRYAAIYQQARISLIRSAAGDVAQRVWETAAMGCLLVMDEGPDVAALGLRDGVNCLLYHATDEAVDQVRWALAHPAEAERIAQAGQAWAVPGTWDARLGVIIDWVEDRPSPPTPLP
jgi:hypothetical protein